ncbi:MAG: hypothetical protein KC649_01965, partial [Candidatus Omnitrophica bacterium]|nr:hypothetical protein [Candidatus Omnitrophota bacterium]
MSNNPEHFTTGARLSKDGAQNNVRQVQMFLNPVMNPDKTFVVSGDAVGEPMQKVYLRTIQSNLDGGKYFVLTGITLFAESPKDSFLSFQLFGKKYSTELENTEANLRKRLDVLVSSASMTPQGALISDESVSVYPASNQKRIYKISADPASAVESVDADGNLPETDLERTTASLNKQLFKLTEEEVSDGVVWIVTNVSITREESGRSLVSFIRRYKLDNDLTTDDMINAIVVSDGAGNALEIYDQKTKEQIYPTQEGYTVYLNPVLDETGKIESEGSLHRFYPGGKSKNVLSDPEIKGAKTILARGVKLKQYTDSSEDGAERKLITFTFAKQSYPVLMESDSGEDVLLDLVADAESGRVQSAFVSGTRNKLYPSDRQIRVYSGYSVSKAQLKTDVLFFASAKVTQNILTDPQIRKKKRVALAGIRLHFTSGRYYFWFAGRRFMLPANFLPKPDAEYFADLKIQYDKNGDVERLKPAIFDSRHSEQLYPVQRVFKSGRTEEFPEEQAETEIPVQSIYEKNDFLSEILKIESEEAFEDEVYILAQKMRRSNPFTARSIPNVTEKTIQILTRLYEMYFDWEENASGFAVSRSDFESLVDFVRINYGDDPVLVWQFIYEALDRAMDVESDRAGNIFKRQELLLTKRLSVTQSISSNGSADGKKRGGKKRSRSDDSGSRLSQDHPWSEPDLELIKEDLIKHGIYSSKFKKIDSVIEPGDTMSYVQYEHVETGIKLIERKFLSSNDNEGALLEKVIQARQQNPYLRQHLLPVFLEPYTPEHYYEINVIESGYQNWFQYSLLNHPRGSAAEYKWKSEIKAIAAELALSGIGHREIDLSQAIMAPNGMLLLRDWRSIGLNESGKNTRIHLFESLKARIIQAGREDEWELILASAGLNEEKVNFILEWNVSTAGAAYVSKAFDLYPKSDIEFALALVKPGEILHVLKSISRNNYKDLKWLIDQGVPVSDLPELASAVRRFKRIRVEEALVLAENKNEVLAAAKVLEATSLVNAQKYLERNVSLSDIPHVVRLSQILKEDDVIQMLADGLDPHEIENMIHAGSGISNKNLKKAFVDIGVPSRFISEFKAAVHLVGLQTVRELVRIQVPWNIIHYAATVVSIVGLDRYRELYESGIPHEYIQFIADAEIRYGTDWIEKRLQENVLTASLDFSNPVISSKEFGYVQKLRQAYPEGASADQAAELWNQSPPEFVRSLFRKAGTVTKSDYEVLELIHGLVSRNGIRLFNHHVQYQPPYLSNVNANDLWSGKYDDSTFLLAIYPASEDRQEINRVCPACAEHNNSHVPNALASVYGVNTESGKLILNLQSDLYRILPNAYKRKYKYYAYQLLMSAEYIERQTLQETGRTGNIHIVTPAAMMDKWERFHPGSAYDLYAKAPKELGYKLQLLPNPIQWGSTDIDLIWAKPVRSEADSEDKPQAALGYLYQPENVSLREALRSANLTRQIFYSHIQEIDANDPAQIHKIADLTQGVSAEIGQPL